jgi:hypothetical protein
MTNRCCDALHSQSRYHERGVLCFTSSCPRLAAKSSHIDRAYTSRDPVMPDLGNSEPAKAAPVHLLPTRPSPPGKTDICLSQHPLIPNLDNTIWKSDCLMATLPRAVELTELSTPWIRVDGCGQAMPIPLLELCSSIAHHAVARVRDCNGRFEKIYDKLGRGKCKA